MVFTLRWGIVATGAIAELFFKDLVADPALRGVTDVAHVPVAVASRSLENPRPLSTPTLLLNSRPNDFSHWQSSSRSFSM
ncbi:hypothetical protein V1506DRAFT_510211 [Lipomyces tetrasporus]